jgi:hypothetical protein
MADEPSGRMAGAAVAIQLFHQDCGFYELPSGGEGPVSH